jgi:CRP-like cAMP-binding protein
MPRRLTDNHILRELPVKEADLLQPRLERMRFKRGDIVIDDGMPCEHLVFPTTAVVSLIQRFENGEAAEVATIGCEGLLGVGTVLGGQPRARLRHLVQIQGEGLRMSREDFERCMSGSTVFSLHVNRYIGHLLETAYLNVACNRLHTVEKRLARWLLMIRDRTNVDRLALTQQILATILGVTRPTVTVAAQAMEEAGLIEYRHGVITIADRARLQSAACECYRIGRQRLKTTSGR